MKNNNKIEKLYLTGEVYILAFAVLGVVLVFSDFWIGVIQLSLAVISLVLNFILISFYHSSNGFTSMVWTLTFL